MELVVYLAGQIHDDWRSDIRNKAQERGLPVTFVGPQEHHETSDNIGETVMGEQPNAVMKDEAASQINNLRTRVLMDKADVVLAWFGDKYKQWNTAMDAATAMQKDIPVILVRERKLHHALKELSDPSQVVVETFDQALDVLAYIMD